MGDSWIIAGTITCEGSPADDVTVSLGVYGADLEPEMIMTTTAESGLYRFEVAQVELEVGDECEVSFSNKENAGWLSLWRNRAFTIVTGVRAYPGGDLDVAGVALLEPYATMPLAFPVRFRWQARGPGRMPGEKYQLEVTNGVGQTFLSELVEGGEYELAGLPPSLAYQEEYRWRILVWADGGLGASFDANPVSFQP